MLIALVHGQMRVGALVTAYQVELAGRGISVEITGSEVRVDGRPVEARLDEPGPSPIRRLFLGDTSKVLVAVPGEARGRWRLFLSAERFDAEALDARAMAIRAMAGRAGAAAVAGVLQAPMPGLVVRVLVAEGDEVAAGSALIVIEAMKMENELKAPASGVVRRVLVEAGEGVEKGTILLELESSG